eukprot:g4920.t1
MATNVPTTRTDILSAMAEIHQTDSSEVETKVGPRIDSGEDSEDEVECDYSNDEVECDYSNDEVECDYSNDEVTTDSSEVETKIGARIDSGEDSEDEVEYDCSNDEEKQTDSSEIEAKVVKRMIEVVDFHDFHRAKVNGEEVFVVKHGSRYRRLYRSHETILEREDISLRKLGGYFVPLWMGQQNLEEVEILGELPFLLLRAKNGGIAAIHNGTLKWKHLKKTFEISLPTNGIPHFLIVGEYVASENNFKQFCFQDIVDDDDYEPENLEGRTISSFDLFCGIGGMAEGLRRSGIHKRWALDTCKYVVASYERHHPETTVIYRDALNFLREMVSQKQQEEKQMAQRKEYLDENNNAEHRGNASVVMRDGEVDLLHASPPCKTHCGSNAYGNRNAKNNHMKQESSEGIVITGKYFEQLKPTYGIVELVSGAVSKTHFDDIRALLRRLIRYGYQIRSKELNSADFGVPQTRKRVFLLIAKHGFELPRFPDTTHDINGTQTMPHGKDKRRWVSAEEAVSDLKVLDPQSRFEVASAYRTSAQNAYQCLMRSEHCYEDKPGKPPIKVVMNHNFLNGRKDKLQNMTKPVPTVYSKNQHGLYIERKTTERIFERNYTIREAMRFQSIPDHITLCGSLRRQYKSVNNAVPSLMAEKLGETIIKCSKANKFDADNHFDDLESPDLLEKEVSTWAPVHINEVYNWYNPESYEKYKKQQRGDGTASAADACNCSDCTSAAVTPNHTMAGLTYDVYYGEYWRNEEPGYGRRSTVDTGGREYVQADYELNGLDVCYEYFEKKFIDGARGSKKRKRVGCESAA